MRTALVLLLFAIAYAIAGEAAAVTEQRKALEGRLKELRAAIAVGTPTPWAGDDFAALAGCVRTVEEAQLAELATAVDRLAEEQAAEAVGRPKLLAYAGKKTEALAKLEALAKAFAPFASATKLLAEAKDEIENDKPGLLLGDFWHGGALGAVRYQGPGGNVMGWFKPPGEKVAKTTGLPFMDFTGKDVLGGPEDENGILLYPDGAPRVRFMVWPGGSPQECIGELQKRAGASRVQAAFQGGMNYLGICSGCFLVTNGWFSLWPGKMGRKEPVIKGPPHDIVMPPFHPLAVLLKADRLKEVSFTGGANEMTLDVPGTEYIGFFRNGGYEGMEGNPALIAYMPPGWAGGRMVVTPAHPEAKRADFLVMMGDYAMRHRYALPRRPIEIGKPVAGVCGDHQNQYYEILVGPDARKVEATLTGLDGACELAIRHGEPPKPRAWQAKEPAKPGVRGKAPDRKASAPSPKPGRYFIQVHGNHDIPNGANYTLQVNVEYAAP